MYDDRQGKPRDDQRQDRPATGRGDELGRLPPPAFPPGARGKMVRKNHRPAADQRDEAADVFPDDAFISPDEPIVRDSRFDSDAFISPDEPIPTRSAEEIDPDEVVVTGIGDDPHLEKEELPKSAHGDPALADLIQRVGHLADGLRGKGEAALRTTADMSRFEATLRAYCVGYLAAQRDIDSD